MEKNFYEIFNIMMQKKQKALVPAIVDREGDDVSRIIATSAHILMSRGYLMSDKLVKSILASNMTTVEAAKYCENIIRNIDDIYGYRLYKPFYSGFPQEVMDTDNSTLIINAILHYMTNGKIVPNTNVVEDIYAPIVRMLDKSVYIDEDDVKILDICFVKAPQKSPHTFKVLPLKCGFFFFYLL